jgi:phenylacetate-CoA ligase
VADTADHQHGTAAAAPFDRDRPARVAQAVADFVHDRDAADLRGEGLASFVRDVAARVPAYRAFLAAHGIDPAAIRTPADVAALPPVDKASYVRAYPLPDRCRDGRLDALDVVAVSSGSSGSPTVWPRSVADELRVARRFERILGGAFRTHERTTLAVVCFPLGTWVGGLFTLACTRHLAAKGYPITTVAPGNVVPEILGAVEDLGPHADQVVLLGYPPFLKEVVDAGRRRGLDWAAYRPAFVLAGEVISEAWRDLVAERAGVADPVRDIASMYGTADAGVVATETPLSTAIRRFLAGRPELVTELFGRPRLPTLAQYDPATLHLDEHDGRLLLTSDGGVPLVRYDIGDAGGVVGHAAMLDFCARHGFTPGAPEPALPFVYVFGRALSSVSFYGTNVDADTVTVALERPPVSDAVTGKFVLETPEDADLNRFLRLTVELAPGVTEPPGLAATAADAVHEHLRRTSGEFRHYVPAERQRPDVVLRPHADPEWFPAGVKHRYVRHT